MHMHMQTHRFEHMQTYTQTLGNIPENKNKYDPVREVIIHTTVLQSTVI